MIDAKHYMDMCERYSRVIEDYERVLADHRRLVRELDVLLNGDGAAKQASLCDIVGQVASKKFKLVRA